MVRVRVIKKQVAKLITYYYHLYYSRGSRFLR